MALNRTDIQHGYRVCLVRVTDPDSIAQGIVTGIIRAKSTGYPYKIGLAGFHAGKNFLIGGTEPEWLVRSVEAGDPL